MALPFSSTLSKPLDGTEAIGKYEPSVGTVDGHRKDAAKVRRTVELYLRPRGELPPERRKSIIFDGFS